MDTHRTLRTSATPPTGILSPRTTISFILFAHRRYTVGIQRTFCVRLASWYTTALLPLT